MRQLVPRLIEIDTIRYIVRVTEKYWTAKNCEVVRTCIVHMRYVLIVLRVRTNSTKIMKSMRQLVIVRR